MSTGPTAPRRTRLLGIGLLVATYIAGAFSGAAFDRLLGADPVNVTRSTTEPAPKKHPDDRDHEPRDREADIFDRLGLTPEQRARVNEILEARKTHVDAFWNEAGPRLRAIVDSTRAEIREVLTPEQRAEYDRIREERRRRRHDREPGHDTKETKNP